MYIDRNLKRINPYASVEYLGEIYVGNILLFPEAVYNLGIVEIPEPTPPEDYSEDTYYRMEQDDAPYVVYQKKPPEQIAQIMLVKCEKALDNMFDQVAQEDRWDNRFTFMARTGHPNIWREKAIAYATWVDECNVQAQAYMRDVVTGDKEVPTTVEEFLAIFPKFEHTQ